VRVCMCVGEKPFKTLGVLLSGPCKTKTKNVPGDNKVCVCVCVCLCVCMCVCLCVHV